MLSVNAEKVVAKRYAMKNEKGEPTENWFEICRRVVSAVAKAEVEGVEKDKFTARAMQLLYDRKFIPNTPCLVNAGKKNGQLAACFVLPVQDSIPDILGTVRDAGMIHKTGGGTGFSFGYLRPKGSIVNSTHGVASGPISFMNIFNTMTETVKQGGVRRGANMAVMPVDHPDILEFIHLKNDDTTMTNFNISVAVTDAFMEALLKGEWYETRFNGKSWGQPIIDPLTNETYKFPDQRLLDWSAWAQKGMLYAPDVWRRLCQSARDWAEPGIIFIDTVNRDNKLIASMGQIKSCNPCGEQFLHSYNSCNLGSIDLSKFYHPQSNELNYGELRDAIRTAVRFLDNVIDVCVWPLPEIENVVKRTRPVGLGIMGWADYLLKRGIRYGSNESFTEAELVMKFIRYNAWRASIELAKEKGGFTEHAFNTEAYDKMLAGLGLSGVPRNYEVTTIAPTGTISLVAETSSGIEPNFSWAYVRQDTLGKRYYVHPLAAKALEIDVDWGSEESIRAAALEVMERKEELPIAFVTAHEVNWEEHLGMLSAFQKHVDNSISKTVNGHHDDTVENVSELYLKAWKAGVKAVSYYRDGSRSDQVLSTLAAEKPVESAPEEPNVVITKAESARVERPKELQGWTWRAFVENQPLYITVNHDGARLLEVFANGPISGSVGILASKMLRGDFVPAEMVRIFQKVRGSHSIIFNQRILTSPEEVIAECLEIAQRRLAGQPDSPKTVVAVDQPDTPTPVNNGSKCPQCKGGPYVVADGCPTCYGCGYSKCS